MALLPQDLELGRLATAYALLRLPRMPEIKQRGRALVGFTPSAVDPDTGEAGPGRVACVHQPAPLPAAGAFDVLWMASGFGLLLTRADFTAHCHPPLGHCSPLQG